MCALWLPRQGRGEREGRVTHRVHALVAPSVRRAEVALTVYPLAAAPPKRLVLTVTAPAADPLNVRAVVVVRYTAGPVIVLDFGVVSMAPDAVEERGRYECREKGGKSEESVRWCHWDVGEHVRVQGLWGNRGDEGVQGFRSRWHRWF